MTPDRSGWWSPCVNAFLLVEAIVCSSGCGRQAQQPPQDRSTTTSPSGSQVVGGGEPFVELAQAAGLDFWHFNGMSGELYFCEIMGAGAALLDYDNDGDQDAYLVQGQMLGSGKTVSDASFAPRMKLPLSGRLYRNELVVRPDLTRELRFTDVTEWSRIEARGYGMGVATGDFDNDGWVDLYLTNFGSNQLWRNNGDGTFSNVTARAGVDDPRWSVSAAFLDYDHDGWLDLFVGNYVDFGLETNKVCYTATLRDYCSPKSYRPVPNRLYRNRGDGTFDDVSAASQIAAEYGGALGVVTADFNDDGWIDIYVANDGRPNQCWINQRDGTFQNRALLGGSALNEAGMPEASMGVDAGDFDADGDEDLFMTHLTKEKNTLYVNLGDATFEDASAPAGLAAPSLPFTGFGTAWFDYDNDAWLDLLAINGAVTMIEGLRQRGDRVPFHQTNQLFRNLGNGRFAEETGRVGGAFRLSEVGRGAAVGDVDNDGDVDVVVSNNNGPARLLVNNIGNRRHWAGLRLIGTAAARDMLGTRVDVRRKNGPPLRRRVHSDGSYASANDPRVLVGLGHAAGEVDVRAWWPDGRLEEWVGLSPDRWLTLTEGSGRQIKAPRRP